MNTVKFIVFSDPVFSSMIKARAGQVAGLACVAACTNLDELKTAYGRAPSSAAIVDESYESSELSEVFDFLKASRIKYVTICKEKKRSFALLSTGSSGAVVKPEDGSNPDEFYVELFFKLRSAYERAEPVSNRVLKHDFGRVYSTIIAIGSSTGGTGAVFEVLKRIPANCPPILIVQHMPEFFTKLYAEKLNNDCKMSVWEAKDGDILRPGLCLLAPGKKQMALTKPVAGFAVSVTDDTENRIHVPSVDVLFRSVARLVLNTSVIGVILTGMGSDGAEGLLEMRRAGAYTIGQDMESSVVYGMPKAAFDCGAVELQLPLGEIADEIMKLIYSRSN